MQVFENCCELQLVEFRETIISLGFQAFKFCFTLQSLEISDTVLWDVINYIQLFFLKI